MMERTVINRKNLRHLLGADHFIRVGPQFADDIESHIVSAVERYAEKFPVELSELRRGKIQTAPSIQFALTRKKSGGVSILLKIPEAPFSAASFLGPLIAIAVADESDDGAAPVHSVQFPLRLCLDECRDLLGKYTIYRHALGETSEEREYVGLTGRWWATRFLEHVGQARNRSNCLFHRALREKAKASRSHCVLAAGLTFDEAMHYEEVAVSVMSLAPLGLNMIPGGYAGLKWLAENGSALSQRQYENREVHLDALLERAARAGRPNPLMAARWRMDDFAASVICNNPRNFDRDAVAYIRKLAELSWKEGAIAREMNCGKARIADVLSGRTYSRIR